MAADTIRFIVTVAIVVYKGLIPVVGRMLTYKIIGKYIIDKKLPGHIQFIYARVKLRFYLLRAEVSSRSNLHSVDNLFRY